MTNLQNKRNFKALSVHELKPSGWLKDQLRIQAEGLAGHLDEFWPDIKDSKWFGSNADGWERAPYWLDGYIPLAWLLEDEKLIKRANHYMDCILNMQSEDGWICPVETNERYRYDVWSFFLVLKVLVVYEDASKDPRVENAVKKGLLALDRHLDAVTLFNWGQMRWFECLIPIFWLYEKTKEDWLMNLGHKLACYGFDWISFFDAWPYKEAQQEKGRWSYMDHVVNNAMMLKSGMLLKKLTNKKEYGEFATKALQMLDESHGMATGMFTGDECLGGTSPIRGTELCAVAELMYSLECLIAEEENPDFCDRLEKLAFNALPATFSPDMWTHQYDQQVNQVQCSIEENVVFGTNSADSNIFGLEPHFGCCTANFGQAWPKFAMSLVMKTQTGLVVTAYAPGIVKTIVNGVAVTLEMVTEYPFRDKIIINVRAQEPVKFTLTLRHPSFYQSMKVQIDEVRLKPEKGFFDINRVWSDEQVFLTFKTQAEVVSRPNGMACISRGPLLYALRLEEKWVQLPDENPVKAFPHCDYEVFATSDWNFALPAQVLKDKLDLKFSQKPVRNQFPFSPDGAPLTAEIELIPIEWQMENGAASYPVTPKAIGERVVKTLIPYGCTNLRITEFPVLKD